MIFVGRVLAYVLAFVLPPVVALVAGVKAARAGRYAALPAAAPTATPEQASAPPAHVPDRPTAVVLLNPEGAEVTDVLAPFEVLSASGAFNVYLVAPDRHPVTLCGGLEVVPQLTVADLNQRLGGREPDLVMVPAMWHVGSADQQVVAEWLKSHAAGVGTLVSICDGADLGDPLVEHHPDPGLVPTRPAGRPAGDGDDAHRRRPGHPRPLPARTDVRRAP